MKHFQVSFKLPDIKFPFVDPFYIRQTRSLRLLHHEAVELTNRLFNTRNAQEAYDQEEGIKHMQNFTALVRNQAEKLGPTRIIRILRRRSRGGFVFKTELDKDITRSEVLQQNIEYELEAMFNRKMLFLGWAILVISAIAATLLITHQLGVSLPQIDPHLR